MASYVVVNIDTTSPTIEIYAPSYTTTDINNEITVQANENLSLNDVEIYTIDYQGVRTDYTFELDGDKYIGDIRFADAPVGSIITLYARVSDDVNNISNLVSKTIHIVTNITILSLDINDRVIADISINDKSMDTGIGNRSMRLDVEDMDRSEKIGDS